MSWMLGERKWAASTSSPHPPLEDEAPYTLGYMVFPTPDAGLIDAQDHPSDETVDLQHDEDISDTISSLKAAGEAARRREAAVAYAGEVAWVRSGGLLRDSSGRVDHVRTAAMRAEIERLQALERAWAIWDAYEERWRRLQSLRGDLGASTLGMSTSLASFEGEELGWEDIPWPTEPDTLDWMEREEARKRKERHPTGSMWLKPDRISRPSALSSAQPLLPPAPDQPQARVAHHGQKQLTPETIGCFLLSPVTTLQPQSESVPTSAPVGDPVIEPSFGVERKPPSAHHRIRREMLHWHPDKFDISVLPRVRPSDQERVSEGVGIVWRWLSEQGSRGRKMARDDNAPPE